MPAREQAAEPGEQVVTRHDSDLELALQAEATRRLVHGSRAGARIHAAGVGRDPDLPLREDRQDPLHERDEVLGIAEGGVAGLLLLHDGHRDFGEIVHHQVVHRPAGDLAIRRFQPVAPESLAGGDADGPTHRAPAVQRAATAPTRVSMSGLKPSGSSSAEGGTRGSGTAARPPATTARSLPFPKGFSLPRNRIRALPLQAWPGSFANAG